MIFKYLSKYIYPKQYNKSIFMIDFNKLYDLGYRILLFDLDNTIISYNVIIPSKETIDLINKLKEKFEIIIISNSKEKRVREVCSYLNVDYLSNCLKPLLFKVKKLVKKYPLDKIILIGDQLLTDITVANKLNIYSIIVDAINKKTEFKRTRLNRKFERKVLKKAKKRNELKYNEVLKEYERNI